MPLPSEHVAGNIYDLGYRRYEGERRGRAYAVRSLYFQSLLSVFGIGRRASSKIIPFSLAIIILLPASVQLGLVALATRDVGVARPENYFRFIQLILALFCAAVAPELVGRDQRTRTLSLYFSRSLLRSDYVAAKLAALVSAVLIVLLVPQVLLLAGGALGSSDSWGYLQDHWDQVPPILGSALAISLLMSSVSLAIAAQTARRAFATGGVLAFFVLSTSVGSVVFATTSGDYRRYSALLDWFTMLDGLTLWLFRARAGAASVNAEADLSGWVYLAAAVAISAAGLALLFQRYRKVPL
jgi:ABC-2 type transport system permease protein